MPESFLPCCLSQILSLEIIRFETFPTVGSRGPTGALLWPFGVLLFFGGELPPTVFFLTSPVLRDKSLKQSL